MRYLISERSVEKAMNTVNTAMNTALNAAANTTVSSGVGTIVLRAAIISIAIIVVGYLVYRFMTDAPEKPTQPAMLTSPTPASTATPTPSESTVPVSTPERWCFVGEDVTGRWCVKVPSEHACDPNRTFTEQSECELVQASPMPLGVIEQGGARMQPIGPIPAMSNTF